jgi:hypothetical protein
MITAKHLLELQKQAPFQPFQIHTSGGKTFKVDHPENFFVFRDSVLMARPGKDRYGDRIAMLHIAGLSSVDV